MRAPSADRPRILIAAAVGVVLVVVLVLVVVTRSTGDDDEVRIVRGAPSAGFPLRGDRAGDAQLIRSAADAWRARATRDGGRWAGDEQGEVTVLWAGRTGADRYAVVLAAGSDAAVLTRDREVSDDYWEVSDATVQSDEDPRIVAAEDAVLVRAGARPAFRQAEAEGAGSPALTDSAGLWQRGGTDLPAGALVLPEGLPGRNPVGTPQPAAVFTGATPAVRELSGELLQRLTSGDESRIGPAAQRLVVAARAAELDPQSETDRVPGRDRQHPGDAPDLELVSDRALPPLGPVLLLSVGGRSDRRFLVGATGGSAAANTDDAQPIRFGGAAPEDGLRGALGPAMGAAYVRERARGSNGGRSFRPYLVVAGDSDVARIEVIAGQRTYEVRGPIGLVRATWATTDGNGAMARAADVAVLGRTVNGRLVVPAPGVAVLAQPAG